eukprot:TRINITY_DN60563_c0_g1_i2.p1 TRINITY_DN60563_c0_g1~~TRINITY_DN60563_c0_g1_i2.p1  ORF type:complete len:248 (-),score=54.56 TRINITY_DN60563_c0_g1_i2:478-1221(-)
MANQYLFLIAQVWVCILVCDADVDNTMTASEVLQNANDGLKMLHALVQDSSPELWQATYKAVQDHGACGAKRDLSSMLEMNHMVDTNWDIANGRLHPAVHDAMKTNPKAYTEMLSRTLKRGETFLQGEDAYLECVMRVVKKKNFHPYIDIVKKQGADIRDDTAARAAVGTMLLGLGFQGKRLVLTHLLNEGMVERIDESMKELLSDKDLVAAQKHLHEYNSSLISINSRVESLTRLMDYYFTHEAEL